MSELMDQAVIGMPYEMAMESELSRRQFYSRAQSILAEAQALREQNTKFQHMLADVVAKHFAENIKRSKAQKSMDVYLSEGIRLLEEEVADARRDAERHELRANQYSEELAALRARVVVPQGYALVPVVATDEMVEHVMATGLYHDQNASAVLRDEYRHMVEAAPSLNGKTVSEGLLRRIVTPAITTSDHEDRLDAMNELRALIGEGKEVGDVPSA